MKARVKATGDRHCSHLIECLAEMINIILGI